MMFESLIAVLTGLLIIAIYTVYQLKKEHNNLRDTIRKLIDYYERKISRDDTDHRTLTKFGSLPSTIGKHAELLRGNALHEHSREPRHKLYFGHPEDVEDHYLSGIDNRKKDWEAEDVALAIHYAGREHEHGVKGLSMEECTQMVSRFVDIQISKHMKLKQEVEDLKSKPN